jgi:hypothetical protein
MFRKFVELQLRLHLTIIFFNFKYSETCLQLFPPEEWLVGSALPSKYAPQRISMILDQLSPERVRYTHAVDMASLFYPTIYIVFLVNTWYMEWFFSNLSYKRR